MLIIFIWGQDYLEGHAEPTSDLYLEKKYNITYENWAYISGIIMVVSSWFLIQNQELVGNLLGGFGAICIAFWLGYSLMKCTPEERDRLIVVGILTLMMKMETQTHLTVLKLLIQYLKQSLG